MPLYEPSTNGTAHTNGDAKDDESWRKEPLSTVLATYGLSPKITEKLKDAGLETVGQLADYTAGGKRLSDIKGIGDTTAEKIEKALEELWQKRAEKVVEQVVEKAADEINVSGELGGVPATAEAN